MDGGAQEKQQRAGTENVAAIVGMAVALQNNCRQLAQNQKHIRELEAGLLSALTNAGIPFVRNGGNDTLPGLISLSFAGVSGEAVMHRLDLMGICISTGSACDSVNTQVSHVLNAIRLPEAYAKGTVRISLGKNNTEEDAAAIAAALKQIVKP